MSQVQVMRKAAANAYAQGMSARRRPQSKAKLRMLALKRELKRVDTSIERTLNRSLALVRRYGGFVSIQPELKAVLDELEARVVRLEKKSA